jgi:NAD(P)-dependent dehydrogenase (short-subunit alcohol dehydrogenase family)
MSRSLLGSAVVGIIATIFFFLNPLFYILEKLFQSKISSTIYRQNVVVITGCDSGFGEMLSKKLSTMGFRVISTCLTDDGMKRLTNIVSLTVKCNITKAEDIVHLSKEVEKFCQSNDTKVWALVNNAGIADGGALDWTSLEVYRRVMEVNFFGLVATTKAMLPFLKANPGSRIVNLSSVAGLVSGSGIGPYFASKHAVEGLAKGLREELKPWGIHVSNVNPSFMRTPILSSGINSARSGFENAPKEITSEYDPSFVDAHIQLMNTASEDPSLVIDVLVQAVTDKYPVMWYFPGFGSNLLRFVCPFLPFPLPEPRFTFPPPLSLFRLSSPTLQIGASVWELIE